MSTLFSVEVSTTGDITQPAISAARHLSVINLSKLFNKLAGGNGPTGAVLTFRNSQVKAAGTVTLSSSSGTVGATINGVSVTVSFDTSDTITATALAVAINASASALVAGFVTAASVAGVVTITCIRGGLSGNAITLAASGTGATASGARLTAGAETRFSTTY